MFVYLQNGEEEEEADEKKGTEQGRSKRGVVELE